MSRVIIKTLALSLSAVLMLVSPYGCSSKKEKNKNEINGIKQEVTGIKADPATIRIRIASTNSDRFSRHKGKLTDEILKELTDRVKTELNINLSFEVMNFPDPHYWISTVYTDKFNEYDAVIFTDSFNFLPNKDVLMDLTDLLPGYLEKIYDSFTPEELKQVTFNGKIAAIPNHYDGSGRLCAVVRADLLEKSGMSDIATLDDYEAFMDSAKKQDPKLYNYSTIPFYDIFLQPNGYANYVQHFVYKPDDTGLELVPLENTDIFQSIYSTYKLWLEKRYIQRDRFENEEDARDVTLRYCTYSMETLDELVTGGVLASYLSDWDTALESARILNDKCKLKIFPMYLDRLASRTSLNNPVIVFGKNAPNPEKVLELIAWIKNSRENMDLLLHGIEGRDYSLADNKLRPMTDQSTGWQGNDVFLNSQLELPYAADSEINPTGYDPATDPKLEYAPLDSFMPVFSSEVNDMLGRRRGWFSSWFLQGYMEQQKNIKKGNSFSDEDVVRFIRDNCGKEINAFPKIQEQVRAWVR